MNDKTGNRGGRGREKGEGGPAGCMAQEGKWERREEEGKEKEVKRSEKENR